MTDKVYHSFGRKYRSRAAATAIQFGGGSEGWVVPSSDRVMEDPEGDLVSGALNAFAESHSSSSFDVTIDTGEALVGGAWLARDTTTTVTLASSTAGQTVYVGWGDSQTDTVIIGKSGAFESNDKKIPIWTFDTDGSGVTSASDERNRDDYRIAQENVEQGQGSGFNADLLRGNTPEDVKEIKYVQTTEPAYDAGSTWLDPSTGIYYAAYDAGGGGDWHPIPPVQETEEASTFNESDVTVSKADVVVQNDSISLVDNETVSRPADDTSATLNNKYGVRINPNTKLESADITATISSLTSGLGHVYLYDVSDGTLVDDVTGSFSGGDTVTLSGTLQEGQAYNLVADNDGADYTTGYISESASVSGVAVDITGGASGSTSTFSDTNNIVDVAVPSVSSGEATVSWLAPSDIKSWDLATFQRTLNNESVTIDVLDGSGSVLFSDISQNFDISTVDTAKNVQIRASLSRSDTANNPTFDYAARRFVR